MPGAVVAGPEFPSAVYQNCVSVGQLLVAAFQAFALLSGALVPADDVPTVEQVPL
jgi:hypothetical protein